MIKKIVQFLSINGQEIIQLMSYMTPSRTWDFIKWMDNNYPGLAFSYLCHVMRAVEDDIHSMIFLRRLCSIKEFLADILSPLRAKLITGLLEDDSVEDVLSAGNIQGIEKLPPKTAPQLVLEIRGLIDRLEKEKDMDDDAKKNTQNIENMSYFNLERATSDDDDDLEDDDDVNVFADEELDAEEFKADMFLDNLEAVMTPFITKKNEGENMTPEDLAHFKKLIKDFNKEIKLEGFEALDVAGYRLCIENSVEIQIKNNPLTLGDSEETINEKVAMLKKFNAIKAIPDKVIEDTIAGERQRLLQEEEEKYIEAKLFSEEDKNLFIAEQEETSNAVVEKFIKKNLKGILASKKRFSIKSLACCNNLLCSVDTLYENFPHFSEAIEYIEDYCYLQKNGDGVFYVPPTLFAGEAGVGKTFFAHELSSLVATHFDVFHMESITASWLIAGSSASWQGGSTGKIFTTLTSQNCMNPIFLLDEIDKCMTGNYPPEHTLLPLLEQFTAKKFKDECIPLPIDASHIVWFATANEIHKISVPLKNRFNIFDIPNPNHAQKKILVKNIYQKIMSGNSWGHHFAKELSDTLQDAFASLMTTGSARDLRKIITGACAKAMRAGRFEIILADIPRVHNSYNMGFI